MKVAITGATGFVGRHVLSELASRGLEITATSFQSTLPLRSSSSIRTIAMDIHEPQSDPFTAFGKPDLLIHLAWSGLPYYNSAHHLDVELPAQAEFLSACVRSGIERIVVGGTCFEYGMVSGEIKEDQSLHPITNYGKAKAQLFEKMVNLRKEHSFELAWARLFYLYGSGQSPKSLYSQLQTAIFRGDECFDMSGGDQIRDYLPIEVAARLLVDVALFAGDIGAVNLCSGTPVRLVDQIRTWLTPHDSVPRLNVGQLPYSTFEPMEFWGSSEKLNYALRNECK